MEQHLYVAAKLLILQILSTIDLPRYGQVEAGSRKSEPNKGLKTAKTMRDIVSLTVFQS